MHKLSDATIRGTLAPGKYGDGGGLWLLVGPTGSKSWVYRYKLAGRERSMGLGPYPALSLANARIEAQRRRQVRASGLDPIEARNKERQQARLDAARAVTFKEAAEQFIASRSPAWKNKKHRENWPDTFDAYVYPLVGNLPVATIDNRYVLEVLQQVVPAVVTGDGREVYPSGPLWIARPYTANRVRGRIEAVLDWARFNGYRQGDNPARWKGNLDFALHKVAKVEHHPALPFAEVAAFLGDLRGCDGVAASALEFLIFTVGRTNEVLGAKWPELEKDHTWIVPAERMKSGREHRVPLPPPAQAVIARMRSLRRGDYVFPSARADKPLSNMALLALLRRMKRTEITVHGMRSTFRDWAAECTSFANEVAEMALAHVVESDTEAAYRRGDLFEKRRALMQAWADYCDGNTGANVVPMAKAVA